MPDALPLPAFRFSVPLDLFRQRLHGSLCTYNAEVTGAGAQRREPKAVRFWRPVDRLVSGRSPPGSTLAANAACPILNSLHQPDGWRKEPERKPYQPDYHLI